MEIGGALSKAFNHMGSVMSRTISQIGAEKHKVDVILEHITNGIMAFDTDQKLHTYQSCCGGYA